MTDSGGNRFELPFDVGSFVRFSFDEPELFNEFGVGVGDGTCEENVVIVVLE